MSEEELSSLVLANDGRIYFQSNFNRLIVSPFTCQPFKDNPYPTYAVRDIIAYVLQLKTEKETIIEQQKIQQARIKELEEAHKESLAKIEELKKQQDINQARIKALEEKLEQPSEKKASSQSPEEDAAEFKRNPMMFFSEMKLKKQTVQLSPEAQKKIDNLLFDAIALNDISKATSALKNGANIEARRKEFPDTPLGLAMTKKQENMVNFLLQQNADPNATYKSYSNSPYENVPLTHLLISHWNNLNVVNSLIKNKANVNKKDAKGDTPLHWAVLRGEVEIVKTLLQHNAEVNVTNLNDLNPINQAFLLKIPIDPEMRQLLEDAAPSHSTKRRRTA